LLEKDLVARLEAKCKAINVPGLSIIGPVMQLFRASFTCDTTLAEIAIHNKAEMKVLILRN
jgi:hypothetical protein